MLPDQPFDICMVAPAPLPDMPAPEPPDPVAAPPLIPDAPVPSVAAPPPVPAPPAPPPPLWANAAVPRHMASAVIVMNFVIVVLLGDMPFCGKPPNPPRLGWFHGKADEFLSAARFALVVIPALRCLVR
jgi:hypothetical protein